MSHDESQLIIDLYHRLYGTIAEQERRLQSTTEAACSPSVAGSSKSPSHLIDFEWPFPKTPRSSTSAFAETVADLQNSPPLHVTRDDLGSELISNYSPTGQNDRANAGGFSFSTSEDSFDNDSESCHYQAQRRRRRAEATLATFPLRDCRESRNILAETKDIRSSTRIKVSLIRSSAEVNDPHILDDTKSDVQHDDSPPVVPVPQKRRKQSVQAVSPGIFDAMIFAISLQLDGAFQSIRDDIVSQGGLVLRDGFEDLCQCGLSIESTGPLDIKPNMRAAFTALITETHSRKVKYMQALALNIPCLSPKWITSCLQAQTVVDWHPYLLSSGYSDVLGTYISRSMQSSGMRNAKLEQAVGQRQQLFESAVVLVVKQESRRREAQCKPYLQLLRILGASIAWLPNDDNLRNINDGENAGICHWVYCDEDIPAKTERFNNYYFRTRKRKRNAFRVGRHGLRPLGNKQIIESLVLGRLVEACEFM